MQWYKSHPYNVKGSNVSKTQLTSRRFHRFSFGTAPPWRGGKRATANSHEAADPRRLALTLAPDIYCPAWMDFFAPLPVYRASSAS